MTVLLFGHFVFLRQPLFCVSSQARAGMERVAPASFASVRRMRAVPLSMEEILLKWYHLNTLILKIFRIVNKTVNIHKRKTGENLSKTVETCKILQISVLIC